MVLDIPGKLFGQEDVRETATTIAATGTFYLSIPGTGFTAENPNSDDAEYAPDDIWNGTIKATGANIAFGAPVNLPNGAIVTAVIVYGNIATENYFLKRSTIASGTTESTMASAAIGTEDTTISNATIDNSTYGYFIHTDILDASDQIYGARITYTI